MSSGHENHFLVHGSEALRKVARSSCTHCSLYLSTKLGKQNPEYESRHAIEHNKKLRTIDYNHSYVKPDNIESALISCKEATLYA